MKNDFLIAVTQLAAERNLPKELVLGAIEAALASAFRKESLSEVQSISVRIVPATGEVQVFAHKTVVETVTEPQAELSLAEAQKIKPEAQLGDILEIETLVRDAGRIAAQTAKQVVMQRLRAAQSDLVFEEFSAKQGDMLSGVVQKVEARQVILDLGRAEAVLPVTEQVPAERYRPFQRLKVLISEVQRAPRGPQIVVSRTHKDLIRRLFEMEVPEIVSGTVAIRSVAREPGIRSKVAVEARQEGVDAVGSCVGLRGMRIQNIVNELQGEKIDVVQWSRDPSVFLANALSPAQVTRVKVNPEAKTAEVVVPDRQLSLAIGREGQNARLAAKLTGWRIDIKSVTEALAEQAQRGPAVAEALVPDAPPPPASVVASPAPVVTPPAPRGTPSPLAPAPQPAPVAAKPPAPARPLPGDIGLEPAAAPEEEEEAQEAVPAFDLQAWIRSQQRSEDQPVLRFAEDILPDRRGSGRGRKERRRGRTGEEAVRGRRPRPGGTAEPAPTDDADPGSP